MNKGKRWSALENQTLITNILKNQSIKETADVLGRSTYSITAQLEKILNHNNIDVKEIYQKILIDNIQNNKNLNVELNKKIKTKVIDDSFIKEEVNILLNDMISTIEETSHLNKEQLLCYNLAKSNKNILITGPGGCGKSTTIKEIIKYYKRKNINIGVTSSTGISASLINGTTLHSFLQIGLGTKTYTELYEKLKYKSNQKDYKKLKNLQVLIIDEISMIDDKLFTKIAAYLSLIKEIKKPFGGIQLILCGDFYQLPPVNNTYCFKSNIWSRLKIKVIELKTQMRQYDDLEFQNILNNIKENNITEEIYNKLEKLKENKLNSEIKPTILYSKNIDVDRINNNELDKLIKKTNVSTYEFPIKYDYTNKDIKKHLSNPHGLHNLEKKLILCKGLQVMVTHNVDINNKITNGTRGVIVSINYPNVIIKTLSGEIYIMPYVKHINDIDENITYEYMPLKLAYAITIHKSQGQTLDYIQIDLGKNIFENGMAYVALSRAKTLKSIYLSKLDMSAFKVNNEVIKFYKSLK